MIVDRSYNEKDIKSVITHPDIYPRLINENSPPPDLWKPAKGRIYIVGYDAIPFGVLSANRKSDIQYIVHFQVIPEFRKTHAIKFAEKAVQWVWDNTEARKLVAEVPEFHPNVIKFADKVGFIVEGVNYKSCLKDGKLYDQIYLGLSKYE